MIDEHKRLAHIQFLRAVAVLLVVLFHSQLPFFSFGYLGVDIFFVISGYVVTLSFRRRYKTLSLSVLSDFYKRRLRRLMPAFLVVTLTALMFSYFIHPTYVFKNNLLDSIYSLVYLSNFRFMFSLDYFSIDALSRIFLHYWSLSIEEQFYIVFPFLIVLYLKRGWLLSFSIVASALFYVSMDSNTTFYFTLSRTFGLLAGVQLALICLEGKKPALFTNIFLLIVGAWLLFMGGPGMSLIIVPVVSSLIIFGQCWYTFRSELMERLGNQSYSLYLVHWPVFVILSALVSNPEIMLALYFLLSFTLSWLLYRNIELRFNTSPIFSVKFFMCNLVLISVFSVVYLLNYSAEKKFDTNLEDWTANLKENMEKTWNYARESQSLELDAVEVAVLGDSNGKDIFNALYFSSRNVKEKIRYFAISHECGLSLSPVSSGLSKQRILECSKAMDNQLELLLSSSAREVHVALYWKSYEIDDAPLVIKKLKESGKKVVLYGPPVFYGDEVVDILNNIGLSSGIDLSSYLHKGVDRKNISVREIADSQDIQFVNRWDVFCERICPVVNSDGRLLKADKFHLTFEGAKYFGDRLVNVL